MSAQPGAWLAAARRVARLAAAAANCALSCRGFPVLDVEGPDLPPAVLVLRSREFQPLPVEPFSQTRLRPSVFILSSSSSVLAALQRDHPVPDVAAARV